MANDLIIDAHIHTYPTAAIGQQAMEGAGQSGCSGTVPELLPILAKGKISYAVLANMTPTYDMKMAALKDLPADAPQEKKERAEREINQKVIERMRRRNLWSCTSARENPVLVPLVSIDLLQTPAEMQAEIEDKVKNHGARGLKLHPVSNRFYPGDRNLWPAYQKAAEMGLPVLFHSGEAEQAGYPGVDFGRPKNFEPVLQSFPELNIILAHLGRGFLEESVEVARKYKNVYFDTSAMITGTQMKDGFSSDGEAVELIRALGVNRVLFGSDWPWFDPLLAAEQIKRLRLAAEEKRRILGENAASIFELTLDRQKGYEYPNSFKLN